MRIYVLVDKRVPSGLSIYVPPRPIYGVCTFFCRRSANLLLIPVQTLHGRGLIGGEVKQISVSNTGGVPYSSDIINHAVRVVAPSHVAVDGDGKLTGTASLEKIHLAMWTSPRLRTV